MLLGYKGLYFAACWSRRRDIAQEEIGDSETEHLLTLFSRLTFAMSCMISGNKKNIDEDNNKNLVSPNPILSNNRFLNQKTTSFTVLLGIR